MKIMLPGVYGFSRSQLRNDGLRPAMVRGRVLPDPFHVGVEAGLSERDRCSQSTRIAIESGVGPLLLWGK